MHKIKIVARAIAWLLVLPLVASFKVFAILGGADRALQSHSQAIAFLPGISGNYIRNTFYRFALEYCDPSATICFGVLFSKTRTRIERDAYIGPYCMIGWVHVCEDVLIGPHSQIPSGPMTHGIARTDIPIRLQPGELTKVSIGRDTWLGAGSIILADVGSHNIIAAGSVVTKPTQSFTLNGGIPAKMLRKRTTTKDQPSR